MARTRVTGSYVHDPHVQRLRRYCMACGGKGTFPRLGHRLPVHPGCREKLKDLAEHSCTACGRKFARQAYGHLAWDLWRRQMTCVEGLRTRALSDIEGMRI